jgi:hypothetical protein
LIRTLTNLVVLALIAGVAYSLWTWQPSGDGKDELAKYAEQSCSSAIRSRFEVSGVKVNAVRRNERGYVVRASVTLSNGAIARTACVTNSNGTVEDVMIDER